MEQSLKKQSGEKQGSPIIRVASFIVDKRMLFFLLYILITVFSLFSSGWVGVENDLSEYLSETTETRQGLDLMNREFITYGSAKIMAANVTWEQAQDLCEKIRESDGVLDVTFTEEDAAQEEFIKHYNDGAALYDVTFRYPQEDERALQALENVENELSGYDLYVSTSLGDQQADAIEQEMKMIIALVAVVVFAVLLFTSESYGEIPVLILTFVMSMVMNSGTNFLFGTISFVSNSVSSILQLALSVDYAIIFCNRFKEEQADGLSVRDAAIISLSKSIPEILSSSLTTISGLFALIFMQYKIGADMGIVLIKAILLSLLSVFTLMPGLLVLFSGLMERTRHKSFVPKISWCGHFSWATRKWIPPLFLLLFLAGFYYSQQCPYVYGYSTIEAPMKNQTQIADEMITQTFGDDNFVALVVPEHRYESEARLIRELERCPEVRFCQGLANTQALGGYTLTQSLTPREFAELAGIDYEIGEVLYSAYAAQQGDYGRIIGGISVYRVPLMDMFQFLYEKVEEGYVNLDEETLEMLSSADEQIDRGRKQLEGENYDRILVYLNLPQESEETFAFLDQIHEIADKYYEGQDIYVIGESGSQRDLQASFERDNIVVSVVSALFVLVILLFTFKSAGMPVLLIAVIEGAIFLNFSFPAIRHQNLFFMGYLIVSSIQMGANIDYAIVISSRYLELRHEHRDAAGHRVPAADRREAITEALNFAFPTIITSGSMMTLAGVFIGQMTSDPCIAGIGQCLGRGTMISILLVMFVLPQILLIGDRIIEKTAFDVEMPVRMREESGTVVVNGTIRGTVNGTVIGVMNAIVRGDVNAVIVSGSMEKASGDNIPEIDVKEGAV